MNPRTGPIGSNTEPMRTHRNPTESDEILRSGFDRILSDFVGLSDEIQQKNPTLRIGSDSSTRIPIGAGIGFMDLGLGFN